MADISSPLFDPLRFAAFLAEASRAREVVVSEVRPLSGGLVTQEHWRIAVDCRGGALDGEHALVLRFPTGAAIGRSAADQYAVLREAYAMGIPVPEPLYLGNDSAVLGKPFFVMRWVPGEGAGERIVAGGPQPALAKRLAQALAALHRIRPPRPNLLCLGPAPADPARARLDEYEQTLATGDIADAWALAALRLLRARMPAPAAPVLSHGDFRTGNYLVHGAELRAVVDWEFADWSDPVEDIAWFCLGCWRFGAPEREAGGLASRALFQQAYESASGARVEPERFRFWTAMAALRLAVLIRRQSRLGRGETLALLRPQVEETLSRLLAEA